MVNGADTAETDSDTEAVQEVAQQALGSGGENFLGGGAPLGGEPSVVSDGTSDHQGDDYSLVQVRCRRRLLTRTARYQASSSIRRLCVRPHLPMSWRRRAQPARSERVV